MGAAPPTRKARSKPAREMTVPSQERIATPAQRNRLLERVVLQALARDPEALFKLNRALVKLGIPSLNEKDFVESDFVIAFQIIQTALQQDEVATIDFVKENLPEDLELNAAEEPEFNDVRPISEAKRLEELIRNVLRIRRNLVEHRINEIVYLQSAEMEEKLYSDEEAQFLLLEQLNQRRLIDVALRLPDAGGNGKAFTTNKGTTRVKK